MQSKNHRIGLKRLLAINSLIALVPALLNLLMSDHITPAFVGQDLVGNLIYSNCIGFACGYGLMRFWPWATCRRPVAKWLYIGFALLVAALVGSLAANSLLTLIGLVRPSAFWANYVQSVRFALLITFTFGGGIVMYETMRAQLRTRELERETALKLAAEARLSSLESRIHPHFLFNALNSVSALIREDPDRAERLVERIAALLRSSLDADSSLVPLERELKIVEDYLEIEKTRFGGRLQYSIDVPADLDAVEIPRFSLQTLVENSVKYVVSRRPEGGMIRIHASRLGERVHIEVADDGPGFDAAAIPAGHGLDLLQSRLLTLFAMDAALRFERSDAGMCVTLSLPTGHESLSRR